MPYFDQQPYTLRFEWGMPAIEKMGGEAHVVVMVDVLSFTTCVDIACNRGARVFPYPWDVSAVAQYAAERGALVAGARGSNAPYSLSPASLNSIPDGAKLVLPSPNGSSLAFAALSAGAMVVAGCLRNARSVAAWASREGGSVLVVAAGEKWPDGSLRPSTEDLIGAGAILSRMPGSLSPEAEAAVAAFQKAAGKLGPTLRSCSSGKELIERRFSQDVDLAAELDVSYCVPLLVGDAFSSYRD